MSLKMQVLYFEPEFSPQILQDLLRRGTVGATLSWGQGCLLLDLCSGSLLEGLKGSFMKPGSDQCWSHVEQAP